MRTDTYGQIIYDENDLCELYLKDPNRILNQVLTESDISIPSLLELENVPKLKPYKKLDLSVEDFDRQNQTIWHMPQEYIDFDIAKYVLEQCKTDSELQRAGQELLLFQEREMFTLLKYLKYLVDTMRKHNIVWGVGRGSSVASFVLYLIGIHKINSLYYDLDIEEFLK